MIQPTSVPVASALTNGAFPFKPKRLVVVNRIKKICRKLLRLAVIVLVFRFQCGWWLKSNEKVLDLSQFIFKLRKKCLL